MIEFNRIKATIKYTAIYTCHKCGKRRSGGTARTEYDGFSSENLKEFLNNQKRHTRDAPIGWSFCLPSGFKCDTCTKSGAP
jgi:hypothetical protein